MRELNECKAEVFRRSENRIRERRKMRNCVLAWCVPFVLCISVCSVMIWAAMMPGDKSNETIGESIDESYVCSYTEVVIQNANSTYGDFQRVTDKAEVTRLFEAIYSLYDGDCLVSDANEEFKSGSESIKNENENTSYIISFITEDGSETVYTLNNNYLLDANKGVEIILDDAQLSELKVVFGISDPEERSAE